MDIKQGGWKRLCLAIIIILGQKVDGAAIGGKDLSMKIKSRLNESVDPCEDFYEFACGGYLASTHIPEDRESIGVVGEISHQIKIQINNVLSEEISDKDIGPFKFTKLLYRKCMDEGNWVEKK